MGKNSDGVRQRNTKQRRDMSEVSDDSEEEHKVESGWLILGQVGVTSKYRDRVSHKKDYTFCTIKN